MQPGNKPKECPAEMAIPCNSCAFQVIEDYAMVPNLHVPHNNCKGASRPMPLAIRGF